MAEELLGAGMAEAFVNRIKRDYVEAADLSDAQTVLRQLPGWFQIFSPETT